MQEKFKVKAEVDNWDGIKERLEELFNEANLPLKTTMETEIVLEELFVNVCHYAYKDEKGEVELICSIKPNRLVITLIDWGAPFNPFDYPDPDITKPVEERPIGGLGIYLVKEYVSEHEYSYEDGKNTLVLIITY